MYRGGASLLLAPDTVAISGLFGEAAEPTAFSMRPPHVSRRVLWSMGMPPPWRCLLTCPWLLLLLPAPEFLIFPSSLAPPSAPTRLGLDDDFG